MAWFLFCRRNFENESTDTSNSCAQRNTAVGFKILQEQVESQRAHHAPLLQMPIHQVSYEPATKQTSLYVCFSYLSVDMELNS